jgi:hypothetical protein
VVVILAVLPPIGVLCLVNLILGFGIIRRLRAHEVTFRRLFGTQQPTSVSVGSRPHDFLATMLDGTLVSRDELSGPALVGFFQPGCGPCAEQTRPFLDLAGEMRAGDSRVLAIVCGPNELEVREYARRFDADAMTFAETPDGPVATAFGVSGFPTFVLLDPVGRVIAAEHRVDALPTARANG